MSEIPTIYLFGLLILLICLSAFFSSSETGMMSLNRYRLRHLVKRKHRSAVLVNKLLNRPDQLIGVILIGNNFVNILASAIATMIALRLVGDAGIAVATAILTLVILIFAEVTPKTMAAIKPERIAFPAAWVLGPLLRVMYPFVWLVNTICNSLLQLLGFSVTNKHEHHLSTEELRTIVHESGTMITRRNQSMLLSILDLETVTVEDIMIPRSEIIGIDKNDDMEQILSTISDSPHTRLPIFQDDINNVVGILHVRQILPMLHQDKPDKEILLQLAVKPYFIPESTPLNTQLLNFQKHRQSVGLVVDEYGDIQGMTTLSDILEEIVGEMANEADVNNQDIHAQEDGSFFINGSVTVREINKALDWDLPIDGPKTLNGLITERLEEIPQSNVGLQVGNYCIETVQIQDHFIKTARLTRPNLSASNT